MSERIGPYRLERLLGEGGMGKVWLAWDERLGRQVAIKCLRTDTMVANLRERLRREARAVARLNHPAIVHVYDIIESEDLDWIVMELVKGQTLRRLLEEQGPLSPLQAIRIGREIAEGLAEAHAQGVLHRDLKTSNVMVTPSGRTKILDFGLAKDLSPGDAAAQEQSLSEPGLLLGTCYAMSPEQVLAKELDARSDLFSLGSLLYEALTGGPPFRGETPVASLAWVLSVHPRPLVEACPEVPRELSDLVERMLQKEPVDRPGSAREVAGALAALAGPSGASGRADEGSPPVTSGFKSTVVTMDYPMDQRPLPETSRVPGDSRRPGSGSDGRRQIGERRSLTVVCCGLVSLDEDSGEVEPLDLETLSDATATVDELALEVCERLGGRVESSLGQFLWLCFGYPQAHEDDARRAVHAAWELADRVQELRMRTGTLQRRLAVRITVHTGPAVVMARPGKEEQLQLGATLDLTTALQADAPGFGVVVSAATQRLIAAGFLTEPLPPARLPGTGGTVQLYRVVGITDPQQRDSGAVTPLVGRERELDLLLDRLRLALSGTGQVVMISGEPGIGKSRLIRALQERGSSEKEGPQWLVGYGSPLTQGSPLAPFIDLLQRWLFPAEAAAEEKLGRLERHLLACDLPLAESAPLLASLLSLPVEGRHPPPGLSPEAQRRKTLEAIFTLLACMAENQPLVLLIEDLHWVDPSSLALLGLLIDEITSLPLLLLVTFRPELNAPWGHRAHITQLSLSRLSDGETAALIDRVAGDRDLPAAVRQQIVSRTDGVPLFVEELTKTILESGWTGRQPDIPSTLDGSLMARLDRLEGAKWVAQLASVLGRTFPFDLLAAVSGLEEQVLQRGLDELVRAELIHRRGMAPRARYVFKHALVQDAAYASLLTKDRQEIHRRIARALEERLSEPDAADLEVIARHYTEGEELEKAVGHWLRAGRRSIEQSAYAEAVAALERGLELLTALPAEPQRDRRELEIQMLLGSSRILTRGYAAPGVEEAYLRARELCSRLGDPPQLPLVLQGLCFFYGVRAEYRTTVSLGREFLALAEALQDPWLIAEACFCIGKPKQLLGEFDEAWHFYQRSFASYSPSGPPAAFLTVDIGVSSRANGAEVQWVRGYPDQALALGKEALARARRLGHPYSIVYALFNLARLHLQRGEVASLGTFAREALALSESQGFPFFAALARMQIGWASVVGKEDIEGGLALMQHGLDGFRASGARMSQTDWLVMLTETHLRAGRLERGRSLLAEAFELLEQMQERSSHAELYRLRGELALREEGGGRPDAAAASFRKALAIARDQNARSLALRTATRLARLLKTQGRGTEARELLAAIYGTFTEGFETHDLLTARELLDALSAGATS